MVGGRGRGGAKEEFWQEIVHCGGVDVPGFGCDWVVEVWVVAGWQVALGQQV